MRECCSEMSSDAASLVCQDATALRRIFVVVYRLPHMSLGMIGDMHKESGHGGRQILSPTVRDWFES